MKQLTITVLVLLINFTISFGQRSGNEKKIPYVTSAKTEVSNDKRDIKKVRYLEKRTKPAPQNSAKNINTVVQKRAVLKRDSIKK